MDNAGQLHARGACQLGGHRHHASRLRTALGVAGQHSTVVGVEPRTSNTMQQSLQAGRPVRDNSARSVAAGLAPPFAGANCFLHAREFCDAVVTVTEQQIIQATRLAYTNGLVVEPSGAAGLAAFLNQEIERRETEKTVVIVLTGGNVPPEEFLSFNK